MNSMLMTWSLVASWTKTTKTNAAKQIEVLSNAENSMQVSFVSICPCVWVCVCVEHLFRRGNVL